MRKDIIEVARPVPRRRGYVCGYLTTNGTIIDDAARRARWPTSRCRGFLKHISVSIDGPGELHDAARGVKGTFERTAARPPPAAGRGQARRRAACASASTRRWPLRASTRCDRDGRRGRGAGRGRDRPQPPDVRDAGGGRADGRRSSARTDTSADRDLRDARSRASTRPASRVQVGALQDKCREQRHPVRLPAQGLAEHHRELLHGRARRCSGGACTRSCTPGSASAARCSFCPFIRIEVGDLNTLVARRGLEQPALRGTAAELLLERKLFPGLPAVLQGRVVPGGGARDRRRAPRRRVISVTPGRLSQLARVSAASHFEWRGGCVSVMR
ncbi:MAG: hypothetical protein MZU84_03945 [Sphingobacterium sp.]|nr:hypothetical protein [Sphingobacterium sp.]